MPQPAVVAWAGYVWLLQLAVDAGVGYVLVALADSSHGRAVFDDAENSA